MGWVSHLDCFWTEPTFARFLRRLSEFSRVILFDKRGTGLSDRVGALPTLEQRMDDVRAVMAAAGSREAVLLGVSEGGPMCSLFATTYPERTRALVMIGTYAKRQWAPDYPWAPDEAARAAFLDEIADQLGRAGRHRGPRAEPRRRSGVQQLVEQLPAAGRQSRRGAHADADERRDRRPGRAAARARADARAAPDRRSDACSSKKAATSRA